MMTNAAVVLENPVEKKRSTIVLRFNGWEVSNVWPNMSARAFERFCLSNPNMKIERDKHGNITIMPPVSYESGNNEIEIGADIVLWNRKTQLGKVFSSSTMFTLPDGSQRMPDVAWVSLEKHQKLSDKQRKTFAQIVPDFIVDVRSPTDHLEDLKTKMRACWIANGVRLAWLIDPQSQQVWIFRPDGSETTIADFNQTLSGETVLPGLEVPLNVLLQ